MPKEPRKFVNPLLQSTTEASTYTSTETETLPTTETTTYASTPVLPAQRKRGKQAFEQTHERITLWLDKSLKERFDALADEKGKAKSALLDEAIADLLNKHQTHRQEATGTGIPAIEQEVEQLRRQLNIEQRFRTDIEVRHFQAWLRRQLLPQDTDFFTRFLADTRIPRQASRALYEARLRQYDYSAEDITLFQSAWKDMLLQS